MGKRKRPRLGFSDILVHSLFGSWTDEEEKKKRQKAEQERLVIQRAARKKAEEEARRKAEKAKKWRDKYGVDRKKEGK